MSSTSLSVSNATSLSPTIASKPGALALNVLSGFHRGVRAPIEGEACTIGSSPGCDLVLADPDIASEHVQLRFYGRQVAVNAIGGSVRIEGRAPLERGYGCRAKLPITVIIGEAKLHIDRGNTGKSTMRRWFPYAAAILVALVVMPFVAVQSGVSGLLPQKSPLAGSPAPNTASPGDPLTVASIPMRPAIQSDQEVVATLKDRLEKADLGMLSVSADGRRVDVSGQIPPDRMKAWREIQQWFDRSHGGRYVLTSLVSAATVANAPHFVFQAVFFGKTPYVVDARGERRYPGAALQDGWMLKSIEKGQILVVKGGQEFKLTL